MLPPKIPGNSYKAEKQHRNPPNPAVSLIEAGLSRTTPASRLNQGGRRKLRIVQALDRNASCSSSLSNINQSHKSNSQQ